MYEDSPKTRSTPLAYFLWCGGFIFLFGLHRFYLKKYISGTFWLLTLGCLFIGQIFDFFWIPGRVKKLNAFAQLRRHSMPPRMPSPSKTCLDCGERIAVAARLCRHCGSDLTQPRQPSKTCPDCGERIASAARLCRHCGSDLTRPRQYEDNITISACPECEHILEIPSHLIGVPGQCEHCGQHITPYATVT